MYVYGGLERDDTWRFSFAARAWTKVRPGARKVWWVISSDRRSIDLDHYHGRWTTRRRSHPQEGSTRARATPPPQARALPAAPSPPRDATPTRQGVAVGAAPDGRGFFVFGGTRRGKPGSRSPPTPLDDLWHFDATTRRWSLLTQSRLGHGLGHGPVPLAPAARSHASLVAAPPDSLLLYGGAHCTPGCGSRDWPRLTQIDSD